MAFTVSCSLTRSPSEAPATALYDNTVAHAPWPSIHSQAGNQSYGSLCSAQSTAEVVVPEPEENGRRVACLEVSAAPGHAAYRPSQERRHSSPRLSGSREGTPPGERPHRRHSSVRRVHSAAEMNTLASNAGIRKVGRTHGPCCTQRQAARLSEDLRRRMPALADAPAGCARRHSFSTMSPGGRGLHHRFPGAGKICALQFAARGDRLLVARVRKSFDIFRASFSPASAPELVARHEIAAKVTCAEWCPWRSHVALIGDGDGIINCVDTDTGQLLAEVDEHGGHGLRAIASSTLRHHCVAAAAGDGGICLWGGSSIDTQVARFGVGEARVGALAWSAQHEHHLFAGDACGAVVLWDVRRAVQPVLRWCGHAGACSSIVTNLQCGVVSAGKDGTVRVWGDPSCWACGQAAPRGDIGCGAARRTSFAGLAVHEDGWVATGSDAGCVLVAHSGNRHALSQALLPAAVTHVTWHPHAVASTGVPLLAAGDSSGLVHVAAVSAEKL